jgi:hypothetical protein
MLPRDPRGRKLQLEVTPQSLRMRWHRHKKALIAMYRKDIKGWPKFDLKRRHRDPEEEVIPGLKRKHMALFLKALRMSRYNSFET